MEIKASCPSCGNPKSASHELVGQFVNCDNCGTTMRVPSPQRSNPFEKPKHADAPPTIVQQLAFIIGLFLGLLTLLRAAFIIFSGAIATPKDAPAAGGGLGGDALFAQGGTLVTIAILYAVAGVIYLFAGGYIRAKGAVAAMVVLVIGPPHAAITAFSVATVQAFRHGPLAKDVMLKNLAIMDVVTLALLGVFLLLAIAALLTHPSASRIRAGRFFTLLGLYGSIAFAVFLAIEGFMIMEQNLRWMQIPAALQNNIGLNVALWIAGCTLLWLLGVSAGRSPWFGAISGLIAAAAMETFLTFRLWQGGPALLARHDILSYIALGIVIFLIILLACPIALLLKALCERRGNTLISPAAAETKSKDLIFDM